MMLPFAAFVDLSGTGLSTNECGTSNTNPTTPMGTGQEDIRSSAPP